jgi:uncharacterized phage protein (TIGR02220 family)
MGIVIHRDYWEACKQLPKSKQKEFIWAIVAYGMDGEEPPENASWMPVFTVIKGRIGLSSKRSNAGRSGGLLPKQKKDLLPKPKQNGLTSQSDFASLARVEGEDEGEVEYEVEKEKTPIAPYGEIVAYLNTKTGKSYRASSGKTRSLIHARLSEGFTVEDFRRVIDVKCAAWLGDPKMGTYLRPETLFGTKFEGYLNEKSSSEGVDDYARYR